MKSRGRLLIDRARLIMRNALSVGLACWLALATQLPGGEQGRRAIYLDGTVVSIPGKQQGTLYTSDAAVLVFAWDKGKLNVPFTGITKMVYRETVGRQVGAAVGTTVAVGAVGLLILLARKKKHYLSLEWKDDSNDSRFAVFELSKDAFENAIADLEEKTGLQLQVESNEAVNSK